MIPFIPGIQGSQIQRWTIEWQLLRGQGKQGMWSCCCYLMGIMGIPSGASGKEPTGQCRSHTRHRFNPCVRKIPWRRPWQPTPVFLPGEPPWTEEPGGPQSVGVTQSQTGLKGLNTISIQFQFCTGTEFWRLVAKQSQYT